MKVDIGGVLERRTRTLEINRDSSSGKKFMISYAQNFEDVMVARLFDPDYQGFYVDIGAAHPDFLSVTLIFTTGDGLELMLSQVFASIHFCARPGPTI